MRRLFVLLVLALSFAPAVLAADTLTWSRPGVRFSFEYPAGLSMVDDRQTVSAITGSAASVADVEEGTEVGTQLLLFLNPPGTPGTNANLVMGIQPAAKGMKGITPEKYAAIQFDMMPTVLPGARNVGPLRTETLGGLTFWVGTTEFVTSGVQLRLKQWTRFEPKDKVVYVFGVSDEVSTFDERAPVFERILRGISWDGRATLPASDLVTKVGGRPAPQRGAVEEVQPGRDYVEEIPISWTAATSEDGRLIEQRMRRNRLFDDVVHGLDFAYRMPRPLKVTYAETGVVNAWYSPSEHSVTMSYDLGVHLAKVFLSGGHPPEEALQMASDAMLFVLVHELGHAIIGELRLPTTGKEEDSADEFATIVAAIVLPDGEAPSARAAARWFELQSEGVKDVAQLPFWDEHSLDRQRTYRILANLFAHAPLQFRFVEKSIPAERLQEAQLRWPLKPERWGRLLAPWRQSDPVGSADGGVLTPSGKSPSEAGSFRISAGSVSSERGRALIASMEQGGFQELTMHYDRPFLFPRDVRVVVAETPDGASSWDRRAGVMTISVQGALGMADRLVAKLGPEQGMQAFGNAFTFHLIEQISRLLIEELGIAYTGEEEDAAAELTAVLTLAHPEDHGLVEGAAAWYELLAADRASLDDLRMWSPGALEPQRFYDLIGWLHAAQPEAYRWVEERIPEARLQRASRELPEKTRNWERHLGPWVQAANRR